MEMTASPAVFWDSGMPGVRMVSVKLGVPGILREYVDVRSVEQAEREFGAFVERAKAGEQSFSARARKIGDGRAVSGWGKCRLAFDWEAGLDPVSAQATKGSKCDAVLG
jgi:hypothetical protein